MDRNWRVGAVALLFCAIVGCGEKTATEPAASAVPNDPAAQAAYDFLDAVLKGDSRRASGRLSPLAMQRIVESGKQFSPPGLETATFRIGEVRRPNDQQALVQCVLTDTPSAGQQRMEEICCLMRLVDGQWRVSGIAYGTGPNESPVVLDFENPQGESPPPQSMVDRGPAATPTDNPEQPSPPRTAQDGFGSGYSGLR